jgi:hypothetical protein
MNSFDSSKFSAAGLMPRTPVAPTIDPPARPNEAEPSLAQRFESVRHPSAELGYGCVDWFIYGAETRLASTQLSG